VELRIMAGFGADSTSHRYGSTDIGGPLHRQFPRKATNGKIPDRGRVPEGAVADGVSPRSTALGRAGHAHHVSAALDLTVDALDRVGLCSLARCWAGKVM
jgi:hypothetical protein